MYFIFTDPEKDSNYVYNLIGVVVHTGTAEGGHYYSFIRDRTPGQNDRWFLFNDAEVKPFDPQQIASECFGGEMMVRLSKLSFKCNISKSHFIDESQKHRWAACITA